MREERKLTQKAIAKLIGCSKSKVSRIENKGKELTIDDFTSYCHALEIPIKIDLVPIKK